MSSDPKASASDIELALKIADGMAKLPTSQMGLPFDTAPTPPVHWTPTCEWCGEERYCCKSGAEDVEEAYEYAITEPRSAAEERDAIIKMIQNMDPDEQCEPLVELHNVLIKRSQRPQEQ
jgi:hypothetical protein